MIDLAELTALIAEVRSFRGGSLDGDNLDAKLARALEQIVSPANSGAGHEHAPTDDEREALIEVIDIAHDGSHPPVDMVIVTNQSASYYADRLLAAGFRRTVQGEPSTDMRYDEDGSHLYWFDPVEGCWVAFKRVDCVGEEELPERRLPATPAPQGEPSDAAKRAAAIAIFEVYVIHEGGRFDWPAYSYDREKAEYVAERALRAAAEAEGGQP